MTLGPSFFDAFKNFPGTSFIFQVPSGYAGQHLTANAIAQAKAVVAAIGLSNIDSFEIANEPDLYVPQGVRPAGYDISTYVTNFLQYAADVSGNITGLDKKSFRALDLSWQHAAAWNE